MKGGRSMLYIGMVIVVVGVWIVAYAITDWFWPGPATAQVPVTEPPNDPITVIVPSINAVRDSVPLIIDVDSNGNPTVDSNGNWRIEPDKDQKLVQEIAIPDGCEEVEVSVNLDGYILSMMSGNTRHVTVTRPYKIVCRKSAEVGR